MYFKPNLKLDVHGKFDCLPTSTIESNGTLPYVSVVKCIYFQEKLSFIAVLKCQLPGAAPEL